MKKYLIAVVVFLLVILGLLSYSIGHSTMYMTLLRQSNDHIIYMAHESGETVAQDVDGTRTVVTYYNADALNNAISRTGTSFILFHPDYSNMDCVTVTFGDGGEYRIYDGGLNEDGKDVVYLTHIFCGRSRNYQIIGYNTFQRVRQCVSIAGYHGENGVYSGEGE